MAVGFYVIFIDVTAPRVLKSGYSWELSRLTTKNYHEDVNNFDKNFEIQHYSSLA